VNSSENVKYKADVYKTGHDRYILSNASHQLRQVDGKQCRKQDYEYYCDVDGEIVTFFSGAGATVATPLPNPQS